VLVGELQKDLGNFLPMAYLVAIVGVSQLSSCHPKRVRGKASSFTWSDLKGYELAVQWTAALVTDLRDGRVKPAVARELIRLGLEAWRQERKIRGAGQFTGLDSSLAEKLKLIHVGIRDLKAGHIWEGRLIGHRSRSRFCVPLLENLLGGPTNGSCKICRRADRSSIDNEGRAGQKLAVIAKHHGIAYGPSDHHLLWHLGKLTTHGRKIPGHVGAQSVPPVIKIPPNFLSLVLVARENAPNLASKILALCPDSKL
jgi:hypothetical protein